MAFPFLAISQGTTGGTGSGGNSSSGGAGQKGSSSGGVNGSLPAGGSANAKANVQNSKNWNQQDSARVPNSTQQQSNTKNTNQVQQQGSTLNSNMPQQQGNNQNPNTIQSGPITFPGTSSAGAISAFGENGFSMLVTDGGAPLNYQIREDTAFIDSRGVNIPRERFTSQTPATVYYVQSGNDMIATQVVANEAPPVFTAGTITEVSPGILVVEVPGASPTQIRYVDNKTTNYVDQNGDPVPVEMIKSGSTAKVFYTKVGDTLIASKVEVMRRDEDPALPKPPVIIIDNGVTPSRVTKP